MTGFLHSGLHWLRMHGCALGFYGRTSTLASTQCVKVMS